MFPSFDFHHFWELLVSGIKRKYIVNNSKHQKQNSLDLLQTPHMQINVTLHSRGIQAGITFSSLTSFLQYWFSSPSCQNQVWHFKLLHTDCVQVKRYNVFFWSLVIMQSWLSWTRGRMPAYWFRMKVGECIVRKINTLLYSRFFSCTTKGRGGQSNLWCASEIWTCLFSYGKPVTKWMYSLLIEETPNLFLISHNYWFL